MGYISIAVRVLTNLESLSGVETVGNLSRHRTAPVVVPSSNGYTVRFLPVLSGESIAHAYQELLVEEARVLDLPLSEYSKRCEFLKFADETLLKKEGIAPPVDEDDIRRAEVEVLLRDIVADIGGFLYAGREGQPIKRTSCFQVGYAIPAIWEKEAAALESQFHVRFALSDVEKYQIPYNVEVGSALYTFTFNLDLNRIGTPSTQFGNLNQEKEKQLQVSKPKRLNAALLALAKLYSYLSFGAKRSRFLPNMEPVSCVATYSKNLRFVVSPGNGNDYIFMTYKRKEAFTKLLGSLITSSEVQKPDVKLFIFDRENASKDVEGMLYPTLEDMLKALIEDAVKDAAP
jgi:CRISPR-associated protein Csa2